MVFYHADRLHSLSEGMVIDLQPSPEPQTDTFNPFLHNISLHGMYTLSSHGLNMVGCAEFNNPVNDSLTEPCIEEDAEIIRKLVCPSSPSRLQSFFAVPTISDLWRWNDAGYIVLDSCWLWKVQADIECPVVHDARHLRGSLSHRLLQDRGTQKALIDYWIGVFSSDPLPEVLLPLPITVLSRIHIPER